MNQIEISARQIEMIQERLDAGHSPAQVSRGLKRVAGFPERRRQELEQIAQDLVDGKKVVPNIPNAS